MPCGTGPQVNSALGINGGLNLKTSMFHTLQGSIGLFHGLLVSQTRRWKETVSWPFRFIGTWLFGLYAAAIASVFQQLPPGGIQQLLDHMFEPLPAILLGFVMVLSLLMTGSACMAAKLQRSL